MVFACSSCDMKEAEKNQKMGELILELLDGNRINQMVLDIWEKAPDDVKAAIAAEVIKKVKDQIVQVDFSAAPNYMRDRDRPPHPLTIMVQSVWQEVVREAEPSLKEEIRARIKAERVAIVQAAVDAVLPALKSTMTTAIERALRSY